MLLGTLLLAAAGSLTAYNLWDEQRASGAAQEILTGLRAELPAEAEEESGLIQSTPAYLRHPDMEMPEIELDGERYIGTVEIPALSLELPVMSSWDYEKLKKAPCRYAGSAYRDNLVICAHNYRRHFSGIKQLSVGERVCFTDTVGNRFQYRIEDVEILRPEAVEAMVSGAGDLTLFTCTTGGQTRFALRCSRETGDTELP